MPSTLENSTPRKVKRTLENSGLASGQGARSIPSSTATTCSFGWTLGDSVGGWICSRVGTDGAACASAAEGKAMAKAPAEQVSALRIAVCFDRAIAIFLKSPVVITTPCA